MKIRHAGTGLLFAVLAGVAWAQGANGDQQSRAAMLREVEREPAQTSESISQIVNAMSAAVVAGDGVAYLEHVWLDDGAFATEQRAWASDLTRSVPESFELVAANVEAPDWQGVPKNEGSRPRFTTATLTARWKMPGGSDRKVEFPARFVEQDARWLYAGRAWETLKGDGIRIHYAEGLEDIARRVVDEFPEIIEHVHEGFELERDPKRIQEVKLYSSMRELQFSIYPSYVESLAGWNEPGESIKMLSSPRTSGRQIRSLLAHEYGHVASFLLGERIVDAPWWALEGVAELSAEAYGMSWRSVDRVIRGMARDGGLIEWERMADFHNVDRGVARMAYVQGHHIMGYVSERFGRSARNAWLRAMAQGKALDEATHEAFGIGFEALDRQWRESLTAERDDSGEPSSGEPIPSGDG